MVRERAERQQAEENAEEHGTELVELEVVKPRDLIEKFNEILESGNQPGQNA